MASPSDTDTCYIGLMSGTSIDGIDAALVRFGDHQCELVSTHQHDYPGPLRSALKDAINNPGQVTIDQLGSMDNWVAECFASAALAVIAESSIDKSSIQAIGSHGQTIRHQPHAERPFTLQLGDPSRIAAKTGLTTVADFRRRDLALGGEGAPLAPAFHQWLFAASHNSGVVLNLGGIANITVLAAAGNATIGFDTGPGNTLLDAWINENQSQSFDDKGAWAATGCVNEKLLQLMLNDPYLSMAPPKSTGFEYFNMQWLKSALEQCHFETLPPANDIQATLLEFTAQSIANAVRDFAPVCTDIFVCGGGVHNNFLMSRLDEVTKGVTVSSTSAVGLDPDWVEAAAFAWLAMRTLRQQPGNLPSVTGAAQPAVLGGVYFGTS